MRLIPIPPGAKIFMTKGKKFARWQDGRATKNTVQFRTARVQDDNRIRFLSEYW